jgi:3-oxoadipate enol-lactonase
MTEISIGGELFNVLVEGGGNKAVVMLSNPLGTNLHIWDSQVSALREHFRTVRYDSRGHGASVANQGPYTIKTLGHDALAIMDALSIGKVHWLGLSMGSIVGQWLLANAGARIGRAVLASTSAQIPTPELWNSRMQSAQDTGMEGIAATVAERWFTKAFRDTHPEKVEPVMEMVRRTPLRGYLAACAAIRDMDQRETIRSIKNEVLVVAGRHDLSTPPGMGALVASSIEGAKFVTLEASHISNIEDAANFTKITVDFLTAPGTAEAAAARRPRAASPQGVKKAPAKSTTAPAGSNKRPGRKNSR